MMSNNRPRGGVLALVLTCALCPAAAPARAAQVCGWLVETLEDENVHTFDLWLQADADVDTFYQMKGEGLTSEGSRIYSPGSGTYALTAGQASRVWGFGGSLDLPGDVDIVAELHAPPKDIFSDEETPLLATFTFRRHAPEGETAPPAAFATHQCVTLATPPAP